MLIYIKFYKAILDKKPKSKLTAKEAQPAESDDHPPIQNPKR